MARPRRTNPVLTRVIGAAFPMEHADRMADLCARAGVTQSEVVREAVYAFMAQHSEISDAQGVLPLREAS